MVEVPTLREAMTPFPHCLEAGDDLATARRMFAEHPIRHLPVKEHGRPIGLLTPRDILLAGRMNPPPTVGDVCERDVLTVDLHDALAAILDTMVARRLDCALVLRHEQLVGIFTTTDACRLLARLVAESDPDPIVA